MAAALRLGRNGRETVQVQFLSRVPYAFWSSPRSALPHVAEYPGRQEQALVAAVPSPVTQA